MMIAQTSGSQASFSSIDDIINFYSGASRSDAKAKPPMEERPQTDKS